MNTPFKCKNLNYKNMEETMEDNFNNLQVGKIFEYDKKNKRQKISVNPTT